jgi:hypothetical protein
MSTKEWKSEYLYAYGEDAEARALLMDFLKFFEESNNVESTYDQRNERVQGFLDHRNQRFTY